MKLLVAVLIFSGIGFCGVPLPEPKPQPKKPKIENAVINKAVPNYIKLIADGTPPPQPPSCFPYCGGMRVPIIIELHQDKKNNKLAEMPIPDPKCPYMPTIKGNCPGRPQPI